MNVLKPDDKSNSFCRYLILLFLALFSLMFSHYAYAIGVPTNLQATNGTYANKIVINWTAVSGATAYEVYRANSSSDTPGFIGKAFGTNGYVDETVANETTYAYWVKACDSSSCSELSDYVIGFAREVTLTDLAINGPDSVNESSSAQYTASATWSNGNSGTVDANWSENSSYASISSSGLLSTFSVSSDRSVTITASYTSGGTTETATKSVTIVNVLSAPANVQASQGTYADRIETTWNSVSGASYYQIFRANNSSSTPIYQNTSYSTSYADSSVFNETTYAYWIKACDSSGCSDYSDYAIGFRREVSLTGLTISGPDSLAENSTAQYTASATWSNGNSGTVDANWSENSSYASISSSGLLTAYSVTSNRSVTVTASYTSGSVTQTSTKTVTIVNSLDAPSNVQASQGTYADKIQITWNSVSGAGSYQVYRANNSSSTPVLRITVYSTSFGDTSVANETTYAYWIKACDSSGCSDYSDYAIGFRREVSLTGLSISGPDSLAENSTAQYTASATWSNGNSGTVDVSWSENSSYASISSSGLLTSYSVTSNRSVTVAASYTSGSVTQTATKTVTIVNGLDAPSNVQASQGTYADKIQLTWNSVNGAASYQVYRANNSSSTPALRTTVYSTSYSDSSVANESTYAYWIKACDSNGCSALSDYAIGFRREVSLTALSISGPSNLSESSTAQYTASATWSNGNSGTVNANWSENSGYTTISSSGLLSSAAVNSDTSIIITASYTSGSVTKSTTYNVTIVNGIGAPSNVQASEGTYSDKVLVTWNSVNGATSYRVYRANNSGSTPVYRTTVNTISYSDTSVTDETTYAYWVKACDGSSCSDYSDYAIGFARQVKLTAISISGAGEVNANSSAQYTASATWNNGNSGTVDATWSENSPYASFNSSGLLTTQSVTSETSITVTASYTSGDVTKTATKTVIIKRGLIAPSSVNATQGSYPDKVVISWNSVSGATLYKVYRANSSDATPVFKENVNTTTYSDYSAENVKTYAYWVKACIATECSSFSSYVIGYREDMSLSGLTISGPAQVYESSSAQYIAIATWSNGKTSEVSADWSESSGFGDIDSNGLLTSFSISADQNITITAGYTSGEITKTATKVISIINQVDPYLILISPNGGEVWKTGNVYNIAWDYAGEIGSQIRLELYRGSTLVEAASFAVNLKSLQWKLPDSFATSSDYLLKITSTADSTYSDESDGRFSIEAVLNCSNDNPEYCTTAAQCSSIAAYWYGNSCHTQANQPPVIAKLSANETVVKVGETVQFDCQASDPEGSELTYRWDFADNTLVTDNTADITHNFAAAGTYKVTVIVTDEFGKSDLTSLDITVQNTIADKITLALDKTEVYGGDAVYLTVDYSNSKTADIYLALYDNQEQYFTSPTLITGEFKEGISVAVENLQPTQVTKTFGPIQIPELAAGTYTITMLAVKPNVAANATSIKDNAYAIGSIELTILEPSYETKAELSIGNLGGPFNSNITLPIPVVVKNTGQGLAELSVGMTVMTPQGNGIDISEQLLTLAAGQSKELYFSFDSPEDMSGTFNITSAVYSSQGGNAIASATANFDIAKPTGTLRIIESPESVVRGEQMVCTIQVSNTSPLAHSFVIGMSVVAGSENGDLDFPWQLVTLGAGETRELNLQANVPETSLLGTFSAVSALWTDNSFQDKLSSDSFTLKVTNLPSEIRVYSEKHQYGMNDKIPIYVDYEGNQKADIYLGLKLEDGSIYTTSSWQDINMQPGIRPLFVSLGMEKFNGLLDTVEASNFPIGNLKLFLLMVEPGTSTNYDVLIADNIASSSWDLTVTQSTSDNTDKLLAGIPEQWGEPTIASRSANIIGGNYPYYQIDVFEQSGLDLILPVVWQLDERGNRVAIDNYEEWLAVTTWALLSHDKAEAFQYRGSTNPWNNLIGHYAELAQSNHPGKVDKLATTFYEISDELIAGELLLLTTFLGDFSSIPATYTAATQALSGLSFKVAAGVFVLNTGNQAYQLYETFFNDPYGSNDWYWYFHAYASINSDELAQQDNNGLLSQYMSDALSTLDFVSGTASYVDEMMKLISPSVSAGIKSIGASGQGQILNLTSKGGNYALPLSNPQVVLFQTGAFLAPIIISYETSGIGTNIYLAQLNNYHHYNLLAALSSHIEKNIKQIMAPQDADDLYDALLEYQLLISQYYQVQAELYRNLLHRIETVHNTGFFFGSYTVPEEQVQTYEFYRDLTAKENQQANDALSRITRSLYVLYDFYFGDN